MPGVGTDLTGTQTTVFNCNGQNAPTSSAPGLCVVVPKNAGGDFNFTADSTFRSPTDNFSAVMAYQHLDKHVSFFKALDSNLPTAGQSRALVGSMPALVNAFEGNAPLENAFFSGSLDAMVFGQGAAADFAYDATVMYHEFTHGVVFAWGDFNIDIDSLGGLDEPGALNEGTADSMAVSETGRSSIGGFIGSTSNPPAPNLRDMNDPGISKSCQGDGTVVNQFGASSVNGFDGEVHDDGEVWNGFYWEVFSGLKAAGIKGCGGTCEAGPAIQYKALQLAGGTSPTFNNYWQTFKSAAGAMFASQPTVAAYVDCVAKRRKLYRCDRTVPLYAGETKVQFVRLRYSPFQVALQATGATQFNFCSAQGISTTVYARAGTPVVLSVIDPNTGNATITADVHQTFTQACSGGPVSFPLPAPTGGVWYLLVDAPDALVGANPGFELYRFDAASTGMAARPASSAAGTCTNPGPLQISGPTSLPPRGHQTFAATGGSTTGYTWSILTNNSGGSIGASSGVYTAGATGSVSDVARVIDLIGGIKTQTVSVTAGVTLTPPAAMLAPGAKLTFAAAGGSGTGFVWTLTSNGSGGTMDASGGYTAGPTGNATDIVTATDSLGNAGTSTVTVASKGGGCASGGTGDAAAMLAIAAVLLGRQLLRRRPA